MYTCILVIYYMCCYINQNRMQRVITSVRSQVLPRTLKCQRFSSFSAGDIPTACFLPQDEVQARVINVIASIKSAPSNISNTCYFGPDLGFDSLIIKDLLNRLGEEFCVSIPAATGDKIIGVKDAIQFFSTHPKAR